VDETTLADSGDADERDELRRLLLARAGERVAELVEFACAPRERDAAVRMLDADARGAWRTSQTGTGSLFPFATTGSASR